MLKLIPYILVICSFSTQLIHAQTYFNKDYEADTAVWYAGSSIYELKDTSGYIVVGNIPKGGGPNYISFLKLDVFGDTLFTTTISKFNYNETVIYGDLISEGDTNFIFVGHEFADSLAQNTDSVYAKLYKVDINGNLVWDRYYGDVNESTYATDVKSTLDGGYIITGWTTGWGNTGANSSFLLKVDSLGNEEWHKIYGGGQRYSYSVDLTNNNGYIMAGGLYSAVSNIDINWVKTDSLGNMLWSKTVGTPEEDNAFAYITKYLSTGDFILTSSLEVEPGIGVDGQSYMAKIDGITGNIIWSDTTGIEQSSMNDTYNSEAIVLSNGDIVAIGGTDYNATSNDLKAWVEKYNPQGELLWRREFAKYSGPNHNYFWDIHQTYDGGFIICGDLTDVANSVQKLWVLKLDSMGCEVTNCSVSTEEFSDENIDILVYPNPTQEVLNITTAFNYQFISIYNLSGKLVKMIKANTQIKVSDLPQGMYFIKLTGNGNNAVKKFIKE